jgi:hypothetical protein
MRPPSPAHTCATPVRAYDGLVARWLHYEFLLPGTLLMHSGAQPAGMTVEDAERQGVSVRFHCCSAHPTVRCCRCTWTRPAPTTGGLAPLPFDPKRPAEPS